MRKSLIILITVSSLVTFGVFAYKTSDTPVASQDPVLEQHAKIDADRFLTESTVDSSVPVVTSTSEEPVYSLNYGSIFAVVSIPPIGVDYPVREGSGSDILENSIGHYEGTSGPGQLGNFAVAGHDCCREHGSPFARLSELRNRDKIFVETQTIKYTYEVLSLPDCGTVSPLIVDQSQVNVIDPVPCGGSTAWRRLMTLTTCTPSGPSPTPWRLILFAELTNTEAK